MLRKQQFRRTITFQLYHQNADLLNVSRNAGDAPSDFAAVNRNAARHLQIWLPVTSAWEWQAKKINQYARSNATVSLERQGKIITTDPLSMFINVVLPAPLAPIIAIQSPLITWPVTSHRICRVEMVFGWARCSSRSIRLRSVFFGGATDTFKFFQL